MGRETRTGSGLLLLFAAEHRLAKLTAEDIIVIRDNVGNFSFLGLLLRRKKPTDSSSAWCLTKFSRVDDLISADMVCLNPNPCWHQTLFGRTTGGCYVGGTRNRGVCLLSIHSSAVWHLDE